MAFDPVHIKTFTGGEFTLHNGPWTSNQLAEEFEKWAEELRGWNNVKLSEVSIDADRVHVVIANGIQQ